MKPQYSTCTPTTSRAVAARHFHVGKDVSQLLRRLRVSRRAVITVVNPSRKRSDTSKLLRESGGGSLPSIGTTKTAGAAYKELKFSHHGGDYNTGRANTAVNANVTLSPTVIAPCSPAPITFQAPPTSYNAIASPPSGIAYPFPKAPLFLAR